MNRFYTLTLSFLLALLFAGAAITDPETIVWTSIDELDDKLKAEPRPVIIEMYASWCGWCKKMDKTTFADPEVAALLNKTVYLVKINGETTDPFTFLSKPTNGKEMRNSLKVQGYPTFVLLDKKKEKLDVVPGYKTAAQLTRMVTKLSKEN